MNKSKNDLLSNVFNSYNLISFDNHFYYSKVRMKVKCYIIMQGNTEVLSEYANISQKNFLSFEINNVMKKFNRLTDRI